MAVLHRAIKVVDGDAIQYPPFIIGELKLVERADGAYIVWLEHDMTGTKMGPVLNEAKP